jgi:hypothetical protein
MKHYPHIEEFPDQYWMNCVQEAVHRFPKPNENGITGISFQVGINPHWPSQQGRMSPVKKYWVQLVWGFEAGFPVINSVGPFSRRVDAEHAAKLFRDGREYACRNLDPLTHYVCVVEIHGRIQPSYAKPPYYDSFDPMI